MSDSLLALYGGMGLEDIVKQTVNAIEFCRQDFESADYEFRVNTIDDINFNKIMDDLSYADPLRIVEHNGKLWAVVHHTIYDKYLRSEMHGNYIMSNGCPIATGTSLIQQLDIKHLISDIHKIKQARWTDGKTPTGTKTITVTKVNV